MASCLRGQVSTCRRPHARRGLKGQNIPVLVTDLSRAEAAKALATFDPIGALAGRDAETRGAPRGRRRGRGRTEELLALLRAARKRGTMTTRTAARQTRRVGYRVVVVCRDEEHQAELLERLETEGLKCKPLMS